MSERALKQLRAIVASVFVLAVLGALFLPVYSDEIGWRFQERAALDGVDRLFSDICGPNTLAAPPFLMMPVRYFSAYTNLLFADPFWVRISGIAYVLIWLGMIFALINRIASQSAARYALGLIAVGLMALANTPLVLALSRPEQPILLAVTGALLIAFADGVPGASDSSLRPTPRKVAWLRCAMLVVLAIIGLSYHLKALFVLPVFLACLFFCCRGSNALVPRVTAGGVMVAVAYVSVRYWLDRLACPDDPVLSKLLSHNSFGTDISDVSSVKELFLFFVQLSANISLSEYVRLVVPVSDPMSGWLPAGQIGELWSQRWENGLYIVWSVLGIAALGGLVLGIRDTLRSHRIDPRAVVAVLLALSAIGWGTTQIARNIYEAAFVLPLFMLAVVLALSCAGSGLRIAKLRGFLAIFSGIAAVASIGATSLLWAPSLREANRHEAYVPQQPFSIAVFGYDKHKPKILELARQCRIPEPAKAHRVLIDELTYFPFMESYLPEHRLGVFEVWNGSIDDPVAYLKARNSDGIIVGCHNLPPELRANAKAQGQFCCLAPPEW